MAVTAAAAHTRPLLRRATGAAGASGTGTGMGVHVETIAPGDGEPRRARSPPPLLPALPAAPGAGPGAAG